MTGVKCFVVQLILLGAMCNTGLQYWWGVFISTLNRVTGNVPGETVSVKVDSVFVHFFECPIRIWRGVPSEWFATFFLCNQTKKQTKNFAVLVFASVMPWPHNIHVTAGVPDETAKQTYWEGCPISSGICLFDMCGYFSKTLLYCIVPVQGKQLS